MPVRETSSFLEGNDQRSDTLKNVVSGSSRKVGDFAIRQDAYRYAAGNDLPQQGVEEQAYERARKGKNLAVPDETSWYSDTSSNGYSSGSDSEPSASLEANRPEKLTLPDKSGLRGGSGFNHFGGGSWWANRMSSDLHSQGGRAVSDLVNGITWGVNKLAKHKRNKKAEKIQRDLEAQHDETERRKRESEEQITKLYNQHLTELLKQRKEIRETTFNEYKRRNPSCDRQSFEEMKQSEVAKLNDEIEVMLQLTPQRWYEMKKYEEERNRDRPGSSRQGPHR
jgi:hypothetical protein